MNTLKNAKKTYNEIPIPAELNERVMAGIRQGKAKRHLRTFCRSMGTAAACFALLVGTLNLSPAAAAAAAEVPILGGLFQVLTLRSYEKEENQIHYQVNIPKVEGESGLTKRVNEEIEQRVNAHVAQMEAMWEDYRTVFLSTGGTEAEWAERTMDLIVDYKILSQSETTVSFLIDLSQCSVNATQERYYYNLDLEQDRDITLSDVLGEHWVELCNKAVEEHIAASKDEDGFTLFFEDGFTTVDESTAFYLRADGTPVLAFEEYTIAAGAAGIVEIPVRP